MLFFTCYVSRSQHHIIIDLFWGHSHYISFMIYLFLCQGHYISFIIDLFLCQGHNIIVSEQRPVAPVPFPRAPNYAPAPVINQPRPRKILPVLTICHFIISPFNENVTTIGKGLGHRHFFCTHNRRKLIFEKTTTTFCLNSWTIM